MRRGFRFGMLALLLAGTVSVGQLGATAQDKPVVIGYSAPGLVGGQLVIQQGLIDHATAKGGEAEAG